jgi:hypothetical protein
MVALLYPSNLVGRPGPIPHEGLNIGSIPHDAIQHMACTPLQFIGNAGDSTQSSCQNVPTETFLKIKFLKKGSWK